MDQKRCQENICVGIVLDRFPFCDCKTGVVDIADYLNAIEGVHQVVIGPVSSFLQLNKASGNFRQLLVQWIGCELLYPAFVPGENFAYVLGFGMRKGSARASSKSCGPGWKQQLRRFVQ